METIAAIILAGGQGRRMGGDVPKQYLTIHEKPILYYTIKAFEDSELVGKIIIVCGKNQEDYCNQEIVSKYGFKKVVCIVEGGKERYDSVYNGLKAVNQADYVMIHDGARPLVTDKMIKDSVIAVKEHDACICAVPSKDTIKVVDAKGYVVETPNRETLWNVQTPQTFKFSLIKAAYEMVFKNNIQGITDDAMVLERTFGTPIKVVMGDYGNVKVTTPEDLKTIQGLVEEKRE